jgi:hypothetical protein
MRGIGQQRPSSNRSDKEQLLARALYELYAYKRVVTYVVIIIYHYVKDGMNTLTYIRQREIYGAKVVL